MNRRDQQQTPPLRPAWDGIAAWALVILALLLAIVGWGDGRVNGIELLAFLAAGAGMALLALVLHRRTS